VTSLNTPARGVATGTGDGSRPRAALCVTQITSWGIVYYALPVLNLHITAATGRRRACRLRSSPSIALDELTALAQQYHLAPVEDAAQAHGATLTSRPAGTFGTAGCFSFYPTKNMQSIEGGLITTADPALASTLRSAEVVPSLGPQAHRPFRAQLEGDAPSGPSTARTRARVPMPPSGWLGDEHQADNAAADRWGRGRGGQC
jgi:hypothetical protein